MRMRLPVMVLTAAIACASSTSFAIAPLAAAVAAATIVSGINSLHNLLTSNTQTLDAVKEIDGKLDILIAGQSQIVAELSSLRVFLVDAIETASVTDDLRDLHAAQNSFSVAIADPKRIDVNALRGLRPGLERVAFRLPQHGPAAYQGSFAGAALLLLTYRSINLPKSEQAKAMNQIAKDGDAWIDPTVATSVPSTIAAISTEMADIKKQIENFPRKVVTATEYRREMDATPGMECETAYNDFVAITGTIDSGFTGVAGAEPSGETGRCHGHPGGGHPTPLLLRDLVTIVQGYEVSAGGLANNPELNFPLVPVLTNFPPSGFVPVDQINSLVAQYRLKNAQIDYQQKLLLNIRAVLAAIRSWAS